MEFANKKDQSKEISSKTKLHRAWAKKGEINFFLTWKEREAVPFLAYTLIYCIGLNLVLPSPWLILVLCSNKKNVH